MEWDFYEVFVSSEAWDLIPALPVSSYVTLASGVSLGLRFPVCGIGVVLVSLFVD